MATPETKTGEVDVAEYRPGAKKKSVWRFAKAGWWLWRLKEMSNAGRFNLAVVILAALDAAAILIADTLDWRSVVVIFSVIYAVVVLAWFIGFLIMMSLAIKRFFAGRRTQPAADAGNDASYDKVQ